MPFAGFQRHTGVKFSTVAFPLCRHPSSPLNRILTQHSIFIACPVLGVHYKVSLERRYYRRALQLFQGAIHILNGYCRNDDPNVKTILLHQAEQWKMRLIARHEESPDLALDVLQASKYLESLAARIGTPSIWFDTRRQQAWYFMIYGLREHKPEYLAVAYELLKRARASFADISFTSPHLQMRLNLQALHAQTDLLFRMGPETREQARQSLREYATLCQDYPQFYQVHHLAKLGWQGDLREVFSAPFLPFLYLHETLQCTGGKLQGNTD